MSVTNAIFSEYNSVVERVDRVGVSADVSERSRRVNCVCYKADPLPPGKLWQIKVLGTTVGQEFGLVSKQWFLSL